MMFQFLSSVCSLVVSVVGLVVLYGWRVGSESITRIQPDWVSMKVLTAFLFVASGCVVFLSLRPRLGSFGSGMLSVFSFAVLGGLVAALVPGFQVQAETGDVHLTVIPGMPSAGTLLGFVCVGCAGLARLMDFQRMLRPSYYTSGIIGLVALFGYRFGHPAMYYYIPGKSTGMAVHTALCFVLLGLAAVFARYAPQASNLDATHRS